VLLLQHALLFLLARLFAFFCGDDYWAAEGDHGGAGDGGVLHAGDHLGADVLDEVLHLLIHGFHALAHLQDDGDAGDVDAEIAGEVEDELEALEVFVGIEAGVAFGAGGLEEAFALVEAERLGMDVVHLGYGRDHVGASGFAFGGHGQAGRASDSSRRADETLSTHFFGVIL
jgi:hypothetical protein